MIKKLICLLWGHKTVQKAATGNTMKVTSALTENLHTVSLYRLVRLPFCERCGDKVHEDGETLSYPKQ